MTELFKEIPGPYFLLLYSVVSIMVIFLAKIYAENDETKNMEVPEPTSVTPLEIALLSKGIKGAMIVSVFNLWRKKRIQLSKTRNNLALKKISCDYDGLNKLEIAILKNLYPQRLYDFFFIPKSKVIIQKLLKSNKVLLENLKFLPDATVKRRYWKSALISSLFLLLFGGAKFCMGISRDKPVAFLFILIVASVIGVFRVVKPHQIQFTSLGKKFMNTASKRFEWLKKKDADSLMADDNLLYGIALFGVAGFMNSSLASILGDPSFLEIYGDSGRVSGSGSGCSSSSGCGGSS